MTEHKLKLNERYFDAVLNGIKRFEIRKADREFNVGDTLVLMKIDSENKYCTHKDMARGIYVPDEIKAKILYILRHEDFPDGIPNGYCVLSIEVMKE